MSTSPDERPAAAPPARFDGEGAGALPVDGLPAGSTRADSPRRDRVAAAACVVLTLAVAAVAGLAWVWSAEAAVWFLAALCAVLALVRPGTSAGGVLRARTTAVDTAILLAAALALALFAPMASLASLASVA